MRWWPMRGPTIPDLMICFMKNPSDSLFNSPEFTSGPGPLSRNRAKKWWLASSAIAAVMSSASGAVIDISGNLPTALQTHVGSGNSARLTANAKTWWSPTTNSINVDLNNFQFEINTGDGNGQTYNGALTGPGTLRLVGNPTASTDWLTDITLGGSAANTPTGVTIIQGRVNLKKTAGVNALSGPITAEVVSSRVARLIWQADNQISDTSSITTTASNGTVHLDLDGYDDTIGAVTLKTGHTINTGDGGILKVSSLTVGGVVKPKGAYTAADGFITGTGYVDVDNFGPPSLPAPAEPSTPSPEDGGTDIHPAGTTKLTWAVANHATRYDVYIWPTSGSKPGTPNGSDVTANEYSLGNLLQSLTSYNWQVVAQNDTGETAGPVWTFTTLDRRNIKGALGMTLDTLVGSGPANLIGDSTTFWPSITSNVAINLNGFTFMVDTGGGNAQTYNGTITGPGSLRFRGRGAADWTPDMRLGGTGANTMDGAEILRGRVVLNKSAGVVALAGPITVNTTEVAILQLTQRDQIDNASEIDSTSSSGAFTFDIGNHNETIGGLSIRSEHRVATGNGVLTTGFLKINGTVMGAGTYTSASHEFITGNGSVVVTTGGGSSFDTWATDSKSLSGSDPNSGFLGDADGDGIPNGLEFVLGSEPNPNSPMAGSTAKLPTAARVGDEFVFSFNRRHEAAYLNPTVEFSQDLEQWTPVADPANATIEVNPASEADEVKVKIPMEGRDTLFARLKAADTSIPGQPAPRITTPPINSKVPDGQSITLLASAGGAKQVSWQWYFDGVAIEGATESSLTVNNVTAANQGRYHVVVTNASGNAISSPALVRVTPTPGVNGLNLVPWPVEIAIGEGHLTIAPGARIVATDASLVPAGEVLASEIAATHALTLPVVTTAVAPGDIVLELDEALEGEKHTVSVDASAIIRGRNAIGVSLGTTTLLQALKTEGGSVICPRVEIEDEPAVGIRAFHLDVARADHSLESLLQTVDLCRLYKINYFHIHFTDDQAYTFPSAAYPNLNTRTIQNGHKVYTLQEMQQLEAYAVARGVYIMPEIEVPGHARMMLLAYPEIFQITYPVGGSVGYVPSSSINVAKAEAREAVRTLIGEMCDVFQATPYFHIGCDEVDWAWSEESEDFKAVFQEWGFNRPNPRDNVHLVFSKFIALASGWVAENGKKTVVWENGAMNSTPEVTVPTDILVMPFDSYGPGSFPAKGYKLINAAWSPLYLVTHIRKPLKSIYDWNISIFGQYSGESDDYVSSVVAPEHVLGAQLTTFEQEEDLEMMSARQRLAAMSERIWNPTLGIGFENFESRLVHTESLLDSILSPVRITYSGLSNPIDRVFGDTATVTMSLTPGAAANGPLTIRYTTNRTDVTNSSTAYTGPITISANGYFRAAAFNSSGQRVGYMVREMHRKEMTVVNNLAAGKSVTATAGTNAARAVDLKAWQGWDVTINASNESLTVDLGSVQNIDRVAALFAPSGTYAYRIEISTDSSSWTQIVQTSTAGTRAGVTHTFASTPARYVRLTLRTANTGSKSVREIMVTGP
jgi:hexosaminidase